VLAIGGNRAIDLIVTKETRGGGKRFGGSAPAGRSLGEHPALGGELVVRPGRYGPYVSHGKVNATLPKGMAPEELTLAQAVELIAAKGGAVKAPGRRAPAGKAVASKGSAKTGAAKKTAAAKAPAARTKKTIVDSDEVPFAVEAPAKKKAR